MTAVKRLKRQVEIFGRIGIWAILRARLCVVGCGGNGSQFIVMAILAGFRDFHLIDHDRLEIHNLNRFAAGGVEDIGKLKVDIVKERIQQIEPEVHCSVIPEKAQGQKGKEAIAASDIVVSAVDSASARVYLQQICTKLQKPLLDLGSGGFLTREGKLHLLGSRVSLYVPGSKGACLFCQTLDEAEAAQPQISLVTSNAIACALGLEILLSHLTGYGERMNFATYDSLRHNITIMQVAGREECQYCSTSREG